MKVINLLILLFFISCQNSKQSFDTSKIYALDKPDRVWYLPKELREISGISIVNYPKIMCINDEEGKLFEYNLETKIIENITKFCKKGDYEDVAIKRDSIVVLRSDGTIFMVKPTHKVDMFDTFLSEKDNTEGLFFDSQKNRLLIACKNKIEVKSGSEYAVYSFDLKANKLNNIPDFRISKDDFKYKIKNRKFAPSGLAINPKTNTLFLISSIGKIMIELNLEGKILNEFSLNYPHFLQPEGILFTKNGDLYISNEGKNGRATILKFSYLQ